jgi:opine dehydrogenase
MNEIKQICVCGGGSLGHVVAGYISATSHCKVNILTRHPSSWSKELLINDINGTSYKGTLNVISDSPKDVIVDSDIVLLCLPGYSIREELENIREYISDRMYVGSIVSSTGFFFMAHEILPPITKLFGFQRVPFIARTSEYGRSANILGYKSSLNLAVESSDAPLDFCEELESLFNTPIHLLNNYYEASLTNSNPLLHTSRLYGLFKDWEEGIYYKKQPLFYSEWTDFDSCNLINMDNEFMNLLDSLPVDKKHIPSILTYYECHDAKSLTCKLNSINAFKNILSPMVYVAGKGYIPDLQSRYFVEDFPYGMSFIHRLCVLNSISMPNINLIFNWGMSLITHY